MFRHYQNRPFPVSFQTRSALALGSIFTEVRPRRYFRVMYQSPAAPPGPEDDDHLEER